MIKGCTKRVIVVKDVSSEIFEEAYFILRPVSSKVKAAHSQSDIMREANRIVSSNECDSSCNAGRISLCRADRQKSGKARDVLLFLFGFLTSAVLYGVYYLL